MGWFVQNELLQLRCSRAAAVSAGGFRAVSELAAPGPAAGLCSQAATPRTWHRCRHQQSRQKNRTTEPVSHLSGWFQVHVGEEGEGMTLQHWLFNDFSLQCFQRRFSILRTVSLCCTLTCSIYLWLPCVDKATRSLGCVMCHKHKPEEETETASHTKHLENRLNLQAGATVTSEYRPQKNSNTQTNLKTVTPKGLIENKELAVGLGEMSGAMRRCTSTQPPGSSWHTHQVWFQFHPPEEFSERCQSATAIYKLSQIFWNSCQQVYWQLTTLNFCFDASRSFNPI